MTSLNMQCNCKFMQTTSIFLTDMYTRVFSGNCVGPYYSDAVIFTQYIAVHLLVTGRHFYKYKLNHTCQNKRTKCDES